jgi:lipoteichoic acid synthase
LLEAGPAGFLMASLFVKMAHGNLSLKSSVPATTSRYCAMLASVLLVAAPLAMLGHTNRFAMAILLNLALTLLLTADRIHVSFFGDVISVAELGQAWQLSLVSSSIRASLKWSDCLNYVDVAAAAVVFPFYVPLVRQLPDASLDVRVLSAAALLGLAVIFSIPASLVAYRDPDKAFDWRSMRLEIVGVIGGIFYHLYDVVIHVSTLVARTQVTETQRARVHTYLQQRRTAVEDRSEVFGIARGRNLIIVQAESLQTFTIGLRILDQPVTPNLEAFAKQSLFFDDFYDQTHIGSTSDSIFVSLQSLHPLNVGAISTRYLANQYRALPAILAEKGYSTFAAMGARGECWNITGMFRKLGFEQTYLDEFYVTGERFGQGLADGDFFAQTAPVLERQAVPFVGFLVTVSNHSPYDLPQEHRRLDVGNLEGTRLGKYLQSVHYSDAAFGAFIERLRKIGLLDESLTVVYGDHEAWLGDSAPLPSLLGFPESDQHASWRAQKTIPLLIRLPDGSHAHVDGTTGGHLDIAPTVLSLLGIPADDVMLGNDLTRGSDSVVAFRDGSFTDGTFAHLHYENRCFEVRSGRQVSCQLLETLRRQALETLEVSDLIIRGNLVPVLRRSPR